MCVFNVKDSFYCVYQLIKFDQSFIKFQVFGMRESERERRTDLMLATRNHWEFIYELDERFGGAHIHTKEHMCDNQKGDPYLRWCNS